MKPIEGEGGKWWAQMLRFICLSWAHSSAAELPTPKSTQDMRPNFTRVQARQGQSLGLCAGNGVRCVTVTLCFSDTSFHPPHQFWIQGHHWNQENSCSLIVFSGRKTVGWLFSYALRNLFGHLYLSKGWPS